jgi:hypothetical protein
VSTAAPTTGRLIPRPEKALADRTAAKVAELVVPQVVEAVTATLAQPDPAADPPSVWQDIIFGATPAPGASFTYTVSGDTLWPLAVMCRLTCSAVAGDRSLTMEYHGTDGVRFNVAGANTTLAASQQQAFCWQPSAGVGSWPVDDVAVAPLPQQLLQHGVSIVLRLVGGDAGDQLDQVRISGLFNATLADTR